MIFKSYTLLKNQIKIVRINKPSRDYTFRSKYEDHKMAKLLEKCLDKVKPDVVHVGHLSHLTTSLIEIVKKY
ncbi:hypothetical protein LCGC14_1857550 [marine sediment metagenome]|uniref:Glycosyltransferase subfamily 4-like N-terminal domain-containing protein n=1 Tax=marine sediment metagenome TaxID=412755 RepID=A0A0F9GWV2_9ZZZZ